MGATRSLNYTEEQLNLSAMAKAMAHPARVAILQYMIATKECINSDLVEVLGLAQPTISQHLQELKKVNLIQGTVAGTRLNYCVHAENWRKVEGLFQEFFASFPELESPDCC